MVKFTHNAKIASFTQSMQSLMGHFQIFKNCCASVIKIWNLCIYAVFSRIWYCRDLRVFCVNFVTSKRRSRKSFDKYHVCLWRDSKSIFADRVDWSKYKLCSFIDFFTKHHTYSLLHFPHMWRLYLGGFWKQMSQFANC